MDSIRVRSPEETLQNYLPFGERMGITRVANITGLDCLDIPVFIACRPNSRGLSLSQGKGLDIASAKVSAFMESVEGYHAERVLKPLIYSSENEIKDLYKICDTSALPHNPHRSYNHYKKIHWIESTNIFNQDKVWIPYDMVHLDYTIPLPSDSGYFLASSNGLASGNTEEEAMIHALLEIIERDSKSKWNALNSDEQLSTKISLDTISSFLCEPLIKQLSQKPVKIGIWDMTSRSGLPTFLCRIISKENEFISGIRPASGMGTHFSKDIALSRAITEAAQSRLTFIAGARDDISKADYKKYQSPELYESWNKNISQETRKNFHDINSIQIENNTLRLSYLLKVLKEIGIRNVYYVPLTIKDFNIPVIRMIAPGAQGYFNLSSKPNFNDIPRGSVC